MRGEQIHAFPVEALGHGAGGQRGLGTASGATPAKTPRAASPAASCSSAKVKSTVLSSRRVR